MSRTRHTSKATSRRNLSDWILLAVIGTAVTGCASLPSTRFVTGLSAEERALAAQLPVYREELPQGSYERVGTVHGYSCQITYDDGYRVSKDNAIEELQRATLKKGATAVMEVTCEHLGRRQGTRGCYRSIVCHGIAVQTIQANAN